jgi:hypothetical protein
LKRDCPQNDGTQPERAPRACRESI